MKIAMVYDMIYPFNVGGIEIRNYEFAKRLIAKGHEVHMFGVKLWKGPNIIKKEGIIMHGVCSYKKLYDFSGKRTIYESLKFAVSLINPLLKEKFDVLDVSTFPFFHCFTCKLVSRLKKTPMISHCNGYFGPYWDIYLGGIKGKIAKIVEKRAIKSNDLHIAVSQTTKKELVDVGVDKDHIHIIYNGLDFSNIPKKNRESKEWDVIFVGRLAHQKNVLLLIRAMDILVKKMLKLKLCIIGEGPERANLEREVVKLGIKSNIHFIGKIKDIKKVYEYMQKSKVFVMPSIWESFGIVVIEANACGVPVIVADYPMNASRELVGHGNGFTVQPNPNALANGIEKLLKDNRLRKSRKEQAVKYSRNFDWDKLAAQLENIYFKIIEEQK